MVDQLPLQLVATAFDHLHLDDIPRSELEVTQDYTMVDPPVDLRTVTTPDELRENIVGIHLRIRFE